MRQSKRRIRVKREVRPYVDKLVISFLTISLLPWILWLSGQDNPIPADEVAGLIALSFVLLGIAGIAAWRAGGAVYVVEALCLALLFAPILPWVIAALPEPFSAPRGEFVGRVLVATVFSWGVAALLAWPFASAHVRGQRRRLTRLDGHPRVGHAVAIFHVDPPERDYEPYSVAICDCDWLGEIHGDAESAFADARKHSPNTDPNIYRPLDDDFEDGGKGTNVEGSPG